MPGRAWTVEHRTLGDLRALVRYFRSSVGPLAMEHQAGSLDLADGSGLSFRTLLVLLDGTDADVRSIYIYGSDRAVREVTSLFRAYRRLRRAERRLADHLRAR